MLTALASTGDAGSSGAATWTPAVIIAVCALLFTVGSFWWINVHRRTVKSFAPFSFAAVINLNIFRIRFPFVFHNTGAAPIVIQNLRIRFLDEPNATPQPWVATRSHIKPEKSDGHAFPAVFSVAGRTAIQTFQEFGSQSLGFRLEAKSYRISLDAKLSHKKEWCSLLDFTLEAWRIQEPEHFITYENSPDNISEDKRDEIQIGLDFAQMGRRQAGTNNNAQ